MIWEMVETVSPDERGQIMGQRDPNVYRRYYMPDFIERDCQAIYLGTIPQDDLVRRMGRLPRDLRAPTFLTDAQKSEIRNDPKLLYLYQKRVQVAKKIKKDFSTIKASEGTRRYKIHKKLQAQINKVRQKLTEARLEKAVKDFFATINTDDVNKHLQGIIPSTEVLAPSMIEYELKERATVAELFFKCHHDLREYQLFQMRMKIIHNLIKLCSRHETPRRHKVSTSQKQLGNFQGHSSQQSCRNPGIDAKGFAYSTALYCPFCRWCDEEASLQKSNKVFARVDGLRKHVRAQHLEWMHPNEEILCPYQGCKESLDGMVHFLSHTAHEHGLHL